MVSSSHVYESNIWTSTSLSCRWECLPGIYELQRSLPTRVDQQTPRLTNDKGTSRALAMANPPFTSTIFPLKTSIYSGFSIATFTIANDFRIDSTILCRRVSQPLDVFLTPNLEMVWNGYAHVRNPQPTNRPVWSHVRNQTWGGSL